MNTLMLSSVLKLPDFAVLTGGILKTGAHLMQLTGMSGVIKTCPFTYPEITSYPLITLENCTVTAYQNVTSITLSRCVSQ